MKKIIIMLLAFVTLFECIAFAASEPSDWAKAEIDEAMVQLLSDTGSDIDYQRPITRKEFAILALDAYTSFAGMVKTQGAITNPFTDMDEPLVLLAYHAGIIKGRSETVFDPDASISRQEICVMLSRVVTGTQEGYTDEIIAADTSAVDVFTTDSGQIADWAKASVGFCVKRGIMKGLSDTEMGPLSQCTVEQALILVKRVKQAAF